MAVGDNALMGHVGRRGVLVGILGTLLTACGLGPRSDVDAVGAALQQAVSALPEHLDGQIQYQDSTNAGTTIAGVLVLAGERREQIEESLLTVLGAVTRTYAEQPGVRTAYVRIEGHPAADAAARVLSADVITPSSGANVTTEDLDAHFGS